MATADHGRRRTHSEFLWFLAGVALMAIGASEYAFTIGTYAQIHLIATAMLIFLLVVGVICFMVGMVFREIRLRYS